MSEKMERNYFDEKKELATDGLARVVKAAGGLTSLIRSWSYEVPNVIDPNQIHEQIHSAKAELDNVRRDFEKVRWAAAETDIQFNEWLVKHGHADLVIG